MVQTANKQETLTSLKNRILALYEYLIKNGDIENAEKTKQLAKKLQNREFMIAFCGHFSAGKSTMINKVVGENLLPSSPIPTSANLVKVKSGEEYAKVFFKNEKPRVYLAPYDYELVKNYCKDGDQIKEIEISHADSQLPANTVIMDTPGIDSADDAHRVATESAIHLADLVLYVMDYNHVQAELNFLFTKELTEAGKEVYLVINQVDKHKEEELSFRQFQNSVTGSFAAWGVKPARIFYTSLKYQDHKLNEFSELKAFISQKLQNKDHLLQQSIFNSLRKIAQDHVEQARNQREDELQPFFEVLNELPEDEKKDLTQTYQSISANLTTLEKGVEETEKEVDTEIAKILNNAYLMPFQTRELAEAFLEAAQPEFKVGFLFSKQKTLEEKNARLDRLFQDLVERTKSQLEWHLREYLIAILKRHSLDDQELQTKAQSFSVEVPIDLIVHTVKQGARVSGEYVLHYTEDLANGIKKIARDAVLDFKNAFMPVLAAQTKKLRDMYTEDFRSIENYVSALSEITKFETETALKESTVVNLLHEYVEDKDDEYLLFNQEEEDAEVIKGQSITKPNAIEKNEPLLPVVKEETSVIRKNETEKARDQVQSMVTRLEQSAKLINVLPGFQKLAKELEDKADRLAHKGFTVALFGAFSAGKSSFANALMGEKVLPVSPNPTTAAINKIKPVNDQYQHGTVLVKFKEENSMLEDINRSLKLFDLQTTALEGAVKEIDKVMLDKGQEGVAEKTHYAFLQAFKKGFLLHGKQLGTVLETDLNEFADFVALEEKSCFVEWIELYYDCELTRKGITLVDTPGADSINARHTGVAFDYIKNSDAILFVTYYNHAFSKADREFLIQLGRVKDSFQLDKMFFIINAIDLAENEEEKETVAEYVTEQLIKYGILKPHLYPLSSLLALKEKLVPNTGARSGMGSFEGDFYHFISNDLTEMALTSAGNELNRVHELVGKLVESSKEDQTVKDKKRTEIEKQKTMIKVLLEKQTADVVQKRMTQEGEELLYYIKQRVFLRFGDFFKEAFNPSVLRDDGRNLKKALQSALDELLESIGFDFAQELRATTVRLDSFAGKVLADYYTGLTRSMREINKDLSFSTFEMKHEGEIEFPLAFRDLNKQLFTKALSYFKNPKSFFEKNEKKLMSDELYQVLNVPADHYLKFEGEKLTAYYAGIVFDQFEKLITQIEQQADDYYVSLLTALDGGVSIEKLQEVYQKLEESMK
ncbi:dynamin family protein [Neobacillus niacini]|uniref:dynamin family protein n=1 Tax=Neobacillus niacini TaxID=86668 RepID=UPI00052FC7F8|nr:dynamin family protein [Neobacillus niacini]KGM45888.1 Dynamin family protein [Neobacillus niacini]MEC1521425.1 dynamin family protein [Neobacillus niacini]